MSSIYLGMSDEETCAAGATKATTHIADRSSEESRVPPGGKSSVCLNDEGPEVAMGHVASSNAFAQGTNMNAGNVLTERSSTGLHAPPGGKTTICLGSDSPPMKSINANTYLGTNGEEMGAAGEMKATTHIADRSSEASRVPPGGKSSMCLDDDAREVAMDHVASSDAPPGGKTTICLGSDSPPMKNANTYLGTNGEEMGAAGATKAKTYMADRSSEESRVPPGGGSSMCLDYDGPEVAIGTVSAKRSNTGLHAPPGGKSTICLGDDGPEVASSNAFAKGTNMNSGGYRVPPGGKSSVCLTDKGPVVAMGHVASSNAFAQGTNMNSGNVLTERSSTGLHAPPGGKSTICLGTDIPSPIKNIKADERDADVQSEVVPCAGQRASIPTPARCEGRAPPGGSSTVLLG